MEKPKHMQGYDAVKFPKTFLERIKLREDWNAKSLAPN